MNAETDFAQPYKKGFQNFRGDPYITADSICNIEKRTMHVKHAELRSHTVILHTLPIHHCNANLLVIV